MLFCTCVCLLGLSIILVLLLHFWFEFCMVGSISYEFLPSFYSTKEEWQLKNDWQFPNDVINAGCVNIWGTKTSHDDEEKFSMKWICLGGEYVSNDEITYDRLSYDIYSNAIWFDEGGDEYGYD